MHKAIANGPVCQVLARPLFLKVKHNSILQKASNETSTRVVCIGNRMDLRAIKE